VEEETGVIHRETQLTAGRIFSSAVINVLIRAGRLPARPRHEERAGGLWRRKILRGTTGEGWGESERSFTHLWDRKRIEVEKNDRIHESSLFVISEQYLLWQVWCGLVHLLDVSSNGTHKHRQLLVYGMLILCFFVLSQSCFQY